MKRSLLSVGLSLAVSATALASTVRVYDTPGGTRLITSRQIDSPGYTLIREYQVAARPKPRSAGIDYRQLRTVDSDYDDAIRQVAQNYGLPPSLLKAVVHVESAFRERAVSPKGAVGLMQLMPQTARHYGVQDRTDPLANLQGGARYLSHLLQRYKSDTPLALAAYNAGEGAVDKYGGNIPPYGETQDYVVKVMYLQRQYLANFN